MRPLKDIKGIIVHPESISGRDAYASMLEGTPYLARKFRLLQGRSLMESPGSFVFGLDELEREIARLPRDTSVWPPNECWRARLVGAIDWGKFLRLSLTVHWYQEGGDPMEKLADLVATLDFSAFAKEEAVERDP